MGVLICRVDIGEGRDQGVFCGNCCKKKIGNLTKCSNRGFVVISSKVTSGT